MKKNIFLVLFLILTLTTGCSEKKTIVSDFNDESDYQNGKIMQFNLQCKDNLNIDGYPQMIIDTNLDKNTGESFIKVAIHNQTETSILKKIDQNDLNQDYPDDVKLYTNPSKMIDSNSTEIIDLAESIYKGKICSDRDILKYAHNISKWEIQNIEYDDNLAAQIYCGTSLGKTASEVITEKKGTCNEYANLCIALLREKGIPTRYVEGFWSMGNKSSYHAWTEVYISDFGWLPIDSMQNEIASIDDEKIRLFVGKDFEDIGHDLKDIEVSNVEETTW